MPDITTKPSPCIAEIAERQIQLSVASPHTAIIDPHLAAAGARLVAAIIRGEADPHCTELGAWGISGA